VGCTPEEVCPRGAVSESGRCLPEQADIEFPALEADTQVVLADTGAQDLDITSNMDSSDAETDTTSASNADIPVESDSDSSNTNTNDDDTSVGEDADEMSSAGSDVPKDAESVEDGI